MYIKKILSIVSFILLAINGFSQTTIQFSNANDGMTYELTSCNGFVIDAGGSGGPGYANNQDVTITICPPAGSGDVINVQFPLFDLDDPPGPGNGDFMEVFDGPDITAPTLGTYSNNGLQGATIQATNLNASGCLTFRFTSDGSVTGQFAGNASCSAPCENPTALAEILNAPAPDSIAVCVGETVDFSDNGSFAVPPYNIDSYTWDFMDGTTATGSTASHSYSQPGQYIVSLTVDDDNADSDPCTNLNLTELKVYVSTYPTFDPFPDDTVLCIGESVDLNASPSQYDSTWVGFPTATTTDEGCLYDTAIGTPQTIDLMSTGFVSGSQITNVSDIQSICLDIEHSFMGDLVIQIQCPTGQMVTLHQQGGGGTYLGVPIDNGSNIQCSPPYPQVANQGTPWTYCFTPNAPQTWVDWVNAQGGFGLTLPAGNYASVDPLSGLIGCPANGTWQIIVTDNWGADDGNITGFSLNLDPSFYPTSNQFTSYVGDGIDSSFWVGPFGPEVTNTTPDGNGITITPTTAGNFQYTYQVTNDFGCSFDSTVNVVVEQGPIADAGIDLTGCIGDLVQLEGGINGGSTSCTYTLQLDDTWGDGWNGNSIDITINGVTTNYTVPFGTQSTFTLNVNHGDQIDLQYDNSGNWTSENEITLIDGNGNVVYQDGQGGVTPTTALQTFTADCYGNVVFEWTPATGLTDNMIPDPEHTITGNQTYTLETYPVGHPDCASTDDMEVTLNITDYAGEDSTVSICTTTPPIDLFDYVVGTGGNVPVTTGVWHDAGSNVLTMPFNPATQSAGDYYYIAGAGGGGCPDTATITINMNAGFNLTADVTDSDCGADNGAIEVHATGGNTPYQFSIDGGTTYQTDSLFSSLQEGQTYTIDVVDNINCSGSIQETIDTVNIPVIQNTVVTDASCNTVCDGEVVITADNSAEYEVINTIPNQSNNNLTGLCAGNYDVVAHNGFGCSDTTQITVVEPPVVQVLSISNDTSICPGSSVTITAEGTSGAGNGYTYNWTLNGNVVGSTQTITVTPQPGIASQYCVEIGENCASPTASDCMTVTTDPRVGPTLSADINSGCSPLNVTFANTTSDPNNDVVSYTWYFGDGSSTQTILADSVEHEYNTPGVFDVQLELTTLSGCIFDTTYQSYIEVYENPVASLFSTNNPASMFDPEIQYLSNSTGSQLTQSWSFEQGNPASSTNEEVLVQFPEATPGNYQVTLTVVDANGCTDTDEEVAVINNDLILYAPNAFTPDGDNHNETWRVFIEGINIYDFNLMIFNRWGEPVWESNNPEGVWDGSYLSTGELAPDGVYVWRITCKDAITDKKYSFNGHITLLK